MALSDKSSARQYPLVAEITIDFNDIQGIDSVATPAIELPTDAVVVGGEIVVDTVFNSTTSDTLDVGDGGQGDRYTSAAPVDITALGRSALSLDGSKYATPDTVDVTFVAGTADTATTGSLRLYVQYIIEDRSNENQGNAEED